MAAASKDENLSPALVSRWLRTSSVAHAQDNEETVGDSPREPQPAADPVQQPPVVRLPQVLPEALSALMLSQENIEDMQIGGGYMPSTVTGNVGEWTGAAAIAIPIESVPGPNGHQPSLSLTYSSNLVEDVYYQGGRNTPDEDALQTQASPFGYGWTLSGVPSISRVSKVEDWEDSDKGGFEINIGGTSARLVRRVEDTGYADPTPSTPAPPYNSPTAERLLFQTYPQRFLYVARITEETDSKVCGYKPYYLESRWEVITKDGTHYEFGGANNTELTDDPECKPVNEDDFNAVQYMLAGGNGVDTGVLPAKWYVTKVTDPHGNTMRFRYRKERAQDPYELEDDHPHYGAYDAAVTLAEITYGGKAEANHRSMVRVVPQTYERRDCTVSINFADPKPSPQPTNTPVYLHWCRGLPTPDTPPGYRSEYLIDRIEVMVKPNEPVGGTPVPASDWESVRTYNLTYDYHNRDVPNEHVYDRALLSDITVADGDIAQPTPVPSSTPVPTATNVNDPTITPRPATATPAPTAKRVLPSYSMEYYDAAADINWLPLESIDNGLGGKTIFEYAATPETASCWNPYREEVREHRRRPVTAKKFYDNGVLRATEDYKYEQPVCSEGLTTEDYGLRGHWYEFLGYGTVKKTLTDNTLSGSPVVEHTTSNYLQCREGGTCAENTPTAYTPPAGTPTAVYRGIEPHPNKGAMTLRQVRANATAQVETEEEYTYTDDDLEMEYIGDNSDAKLTTPWGHLDKIVKRQFGKTVLGTGTTWKSSARVTALKYYTETQGGVQWGNVTNRLEFLSEADFPSSPYRTERTWYNTQVDIDRYDFSVEESSFIVDRPRNSAVLTNSGALPIDNPTPATPDTAAELVWYIYSGNDTPTEGVGTKGDLTRILHLESIDSFPSGLSSTFNTACSGSGTDKFRTIVRDFTYSSGEGAGNQISETEYDDYGYACVADPYETTESVHIDSSTPSQARTTTREYDDVLRSLPTSIENAAGHETELRYYGANSLVLHSSVGGFIGNVERVIDENDAETKYEYDDFGRLSKVIREGDTSLSPSEVYAYSDDVLSPAFPYVHSKWTKREDGAAPWSDGGAFERTFYNGAGEVIEVQKPHYDWEGNPAAAIPTPATGSDVIVHTERDGQGRELAVTNPYAVAAYDEVDCSAQTGGTGATVTPCPNPYATPSPTQHETTTEYDTVGRKTSITMPDGTKKRYHYGVVDSNERHWIEDIMDEKRHRRQFRTDGLGRVVSLRQYDGDCGALGFSCGGAYTTSWDSDAAATKVDYEYDIEDLLESTTRLGFMREFTYDLFGRKTEMVDPDLGTWQYDYDARGQLTEQVDARDKKLCYFYDALGRLTQRRYTVATATCSTTGGTAGPSFAYDSTSGGNAGVGRRTSSSLPDGSSYTWTYDLQGRLTRETQYLAGASGGTYHTDFEYKSDGSVEELGHPDTLDDVEYTYNVVGPDEMSSASKDFVSLTEYTPLGLVDWRELGSTNKVIMDSDYNADDLRLYRIRAGTSATAPHYKEYMDHYYQYDDAGNIIDLDDWTSGFPQEQTFTYDDRDRVTAADATGGHISSSNYDAEYEYQESGNIDGDSDDSEDRDYDYHADKPHAVRKVFSSGPSSDGIIEVRVQRSSSCTGVIWIDVVVNDEYDSSNFYTSLLSGTGWQDKEVYDKFPLTGDDVISVGFDGGGLGTVAGCSVDVDSVTVDGVQIQLEGGKTAFDEGSWGGSYLSSPAQDGEDVVAPDEATVGSAQAIHLEEEGALRFVVGDKARAYEYDENGNAYWRIVESSAYEFVWDEENRLEEVRLDEAAGAAGDVEAKFTYDGDGKRIKAQRGDYYSYYVGDLYEYTEHCNPSCSKADVVSYYDVNGERIAINQGTAWLGRTLYWRLSDHLGSTSKLITASSPAISRDARYKAFGEDRYRSGSMRTTRQYTGQHAEEDLGLYFYEARYYDPSIGRFLSPDQLVADQTFVDEWNRYSYGRNNPIRYKDDSGRYIESAVDIAFIAYDIHEIRTQGLNWTNGLALAADVGGLVLPGLTGGGLAVRAGRAAIRAAETADMSVTAVQAAEQIRSTGEVGVEDALIVAGVAMGVGRPRGPDVSVVNNVARRNAKKDGVGVIYKRTDPRDGSVYIGQSKDTYNYERRRRSHDRKAGVQHLYEELERRQGISRDGLRKLEEDWIRRSGGIKSRGGSLRNRRHEMNDVRYREMGGNVDMPY